MISREIAKMSGTAAITSAIMLVAPMLAFADNPHLLSGSCTVTSSGDLTCTGKEAGLGNISSVNVSIQAQVTCENGGGNFPLGQQSSASKPTSVHNGQLTFDQTLPNPCHDKMAAHYSSAMVVGTIDSTRIFTESLPCTNCV